MGRHVCQIALSPYRASSWIGTTETNFDQLLQFQELVTFLIRGRLWCSDVDSRDDSTRSFGLFHVF